MNRQLVFLSFLFLLFETGEQTCTCSKESFSEDRFLRCTAGAGRVMADRDYKSCANAQRVYLYYINDPSIADREFRGLTPTAKKITAFLPPALCERFCANPTIGYFIVEGNCWCKAPVYKTLPPYRPPSATTTTTRKMRLPPDVPPAPPRANDVTPFSNRQQRPIAPPSQAPVPTFAPVAPPAPKPIYPTLAPPVAPRRQQWTPPPPIVLSTSGSFSSTTSSTRTSTFATSSIRPRVDQKKLAPTTTTSTAPSFVTSTAVSTIAAVAVAPKKPAKFGPLAAEPSTTTSIVATAKKQKPSSKKELSKNSTISPSSFDELTTLKKQLAKLAPPPRPTENVSTSAPVSNASSYWPVVLYRLTTRAAVVEANSSSANIGAPVDSVTTGGGSGPSSGLVCGLAAAVGVLGATVLVMGGVYAVRRRVASRKRARRAYSPREAAVMALGGGVEDDPTPALAAVPLQYVGAVNIDDDVYQSAADVHPRRPIRPAATFSSQHQDRRASCVV